MNSVSKCCGNSGNNPEKFSNKTLLRFLLYIMNVLKELKFKCELWKQTMNYSYLDNHGKCDFISKRFAANGLNVFNSNKEINAYSS